MMRGKEQKDKNWGPVRAKQEPAADADVNNMVQRFFKTGYLPTTGKQPRFGDFTGPGFQEMHNMLALAKAQFMGLDPKLRRRFGNSVGTLVEWVNNPENETEAIKLGLLPEKPPEAPTAVKADPEANPEFKKPKKPEGD